jgi:hypothetical protein
LLSGLQIRIGETEVFEAHPERLPGALFVLPQWIVRLPACALTTAESEFLTAMGGCRQSQRNDKAAMREH